MATTLPTPWHQVVQLRADLRSGDLAANQFAADLNDVVRGQGPALYRDPVEFFALTYPTATLRELARDVLHRLGGRSNKAVRQLDLTYGGGKTHTLITLYHLARDPGTLPRHLSAVGEFIAAAGMEPPKARIAVLPFDKIDPQVGLETPAPDGSTRRLREPWSILAYQIAGDAGLRLLNGDDSVAERAAVPAEPLWVDLLRLPERDGLATLILIDEVLMYAREKVRLDEAWLGVLESFFQVLTQATVKVPRCAIVASLLATDPSKYDEKGRAVINALKAIFNRESEVLVEPVSKTDIAEVLRRRFFTPESIANQDAFRAPTLAALNGVYILDENARKDRPRTEARYLASYPFHPDLTEIFYSRWTQIPSFQRTRGMLRTFALALRDAERWDTTPLIGANVFLSAPESSDLAPAALELADIASRANPEGPAQNWSAILQTEFEKARAIQKEGGRLKHREIEQAVFITFLFSQSADHHASTPEIFTLLGPVAPDKIELEKGLTRWTQTSWYLDENEIANVETRSDGSRGLPKTWRLGTRPNLRQLHHEALQRVNDALVMSELERRIHAERRLTQEAPPDRVHLLPARPADVPDDGELRYVVLGPSAASTVGNLGSEARRYLTDTTGSDRPRANKNCIILALPTTEGSASMRDAVRAWLGWEEVKSMLAGKEPDALRKETLESYLTDARKQIPIAIQYAYAIVATYSTKGEIVAFRVTPGPDPLFKTICEARETRIQEKPIAAGTLLPSGPFDVWRDGEATRWVKDLVGAFATNPRLPKMLNRQSIYETIADGCQRGLFVLREQRPDRSYHTFWRETPANDTLKQPMLEAVLPEAAELTSLATNLLLPKNLPALWSDETLPVAALIGYFDGTHQFTTATNDTITIPRATPEALDQAVHAAVQSGALWLVFPTASFWKEPLPDGLALAEGVLHPEPKALEYNEVLPDALPAAWTGEATTARAIWDALSVKRGAVLPWEVVRRAIHTACQMNQIEVVPGSPTLSTSGTDAVAVKLRQRETTVRSVSQSGYQLRPKIEEATPTSYGIRQARATLSIAEVQNLSEDIAELQRKAASAGLKIEVIIEIGSQQHPNDETVTAINEVLRKIHPGLELQ